MKPEYILCAAIYVDDGISYPSRSYSAPETGLVFTGWRHGDCLTILNAWKDLLPPQTRLMPPIKSFGEQGFLTSEGRFVNRQEAALLALEAKQVTELKFSKTDLYSEDLY